LARTNIKLNRNRITEKGFYLWKVILLRIKGLTALTQRLQKSAKAVQKSREVVKTHGAKLEKTMKRNATFVKGYQTGETKRSINLRSEEHTSELQSRGHLV